jgi:hypothetical protein
MRNIRISMIGAGIFFCASFFIFGKLRVQASGDFSGSRATIPFIQNQGQITQDNVRFYANIFSGSVFVTDQGLQYVTSKKDGQGKNTNFSFAEKFVDAVGSTIQPKPVGTEQSFTRVSVFKGNDSDGWRNDIPSFNVLYLGQIWNGIAVNLQASNKNFEKVFTVSPGGNPSDIKIATDGLTGLAIAANDELILKTQLGELKMTAPVAFQFDEAGNKINVPVKYSIGKNNQYGFVVGEYDKSRELIIDPLLASTFLGGTGDDDGRAIVTDATGNVYVTGQSYADDFPVTVGAYDSGNSSGVFVSKFSNDLSTLEASAFFGGTNGDHSQAIALDSAGNIFITGIAHSFDFPTTAGAYAETPPTTNAPNSFLTEFNSDLSNILASTYLGASDTYPGGMPYTEAYSLAIDESDNVFVGGMTLCTNFPTTSGAYNEVFGGNGWNTFVSKFSHDLSAIQSSTFVGGFGTMYGAGLITDAAGDVYITGGTWDSGFPTTPGAYSTTFNGSMEMFVSRLNNNLSSLVSSTFLGGSDDYGTEYGTSLALDSVGSLFVLGFSNSTDFPTTTGAFDQTANGGTDVVLAKLSNDFSTFLSATYFGGGNNDGTNGDYNLGKALAVDSADNVYIAGLTRNTSDFPVTSGAYQAIYNSSTQGFFAKFSNDLSSVASTTLFGGTNDSWANALAIDSSDNIFAVGSTYAGGFPTTAGVYMETSTDGQLETFVSKWNADFNGTPLSGDEFAGGSGTPGDPYQISDCVQLQAIGGSGGAYLGNSFILQNDIDCSATKISDVADPNYDAALYNGGNGFTPIGSGWGSQFTGALDGNDKKITDLYSNQPGLSYAGLFGMVDSADIKDVGLVGAEIYSNGNVGALIGRSDGATISRVYSAGRVDKPSVWTFHISQLEGAEFKEVYRQSFSNQFSTKEFDFKNLENSLTLEINQTGRTPFAGVDGAVLEACGSRLVPSEAVYVGSNESVLDDILKVDNNVSVVHEKPMRLSWNLPAGCSTATLALTANEYAAAAPFEFPASGAVEYELGSKSGSLVMDGNIGETDGTEPLFVPHWVPTTGHPEGDVFVYVKEDEDYLYFAADVTIDNTNDFGKDWIALVIGEKRFLVNDTDATYGKCGFGLTSKVDYRHQTCELKIPKSEIDTSKKNIALKLQYYGTAGAAYAGGLIGLANSSTIDESYSSARVNGTNNVGGLIGNQSSSIITKSFATGLVTGSQWVGGFVGSNSGNDGVIEDAYAMGDVSGTNAVGGFTGFFNGSLENVYAKGNVSCSDEGCLAEGLAASNYVEDSAIISSYWDTQTSGQPAAGAGVGKTTAEMQTQATFVNWNFDTIWRLDGVKNLGYPYFAWWDGSDPTPDPDADEVGTPEIKDIKNETTDSLELVVKIGKDYAKKYVDLVIREKNKDTGKTRKIEKTEEVDNDGEVNFSIRDLKADTKYEYSVKFSEENLDIWSPYSHTKSGQTEKNKEKSVPAVTPAVVAPDAGAVTPPISENNPPAMEAPKPENNIPEVKKENIVIQKPVVAQSGFFNNLGKSKAKSLAVAVLGAVAGASIAVASTGIPLASTSPQPIQDGALKLFGFVSKKKKEEDWGVIFDSETKRPIGGARIAAMNADGREMSVVFSDVDGRYGILATEGAYSLSVTKKGYDVVLGENHDALYGDIYSGQSLEVKKGEIIKTSIALKSNAIDWKEFAHKKISQFSSIFSVIKKYFFLLVFYAGFVFTAGVAYLFPSWTNFLVLLIYVAIAIYQIFVRQNPYGMVTQASTGQPVPFAIATLYKENDPGRRVGFAVSDVLGRYYFLVEDGTYLVKFAGQFLEGGRFEREARVKVNSGILKADIAV